MAILILKVTGIRASNDAESIEGKLDSLHDDREILIDEKTFDRLVKEGWIGLDNNTQTKG